MAAFSHCHFHLPFLLDSSAFGDQPLTNSTPIPHTSSSDETNQSSTMTTVLDYHEPSLTRTHSPAADTSMAQTKNKKRTNYRNGTSSKEGRTEGRRKKQKKSDDSNGNGNGAGKQEEKPKITQEPPTGYIHVRARRGEATDSHSLAERVRREKISERMRMLQRLVPGCDKITGKALVLDEIINYVQSLQNQVEFLSMKLASVNPMFGDFTMGQDTLMATPDRLINSVTSPLPSVPQCSTNQTTNFAHDYSLLDDSVTVFLQGERSNAFFSSQLDVVGELWDAQDQGQSFPNPCGFDTSLWSFQS